MMVHADGTIEEYCYWDLPPLQPDPSFSEKDVIDQVHELLIDAVRLRLRSDVPVGVFLSGGVDSSLIAAIASKLQPGIQTFSVGYEDQRIDESKYAAKVAEHLNTEHHTILVKAGELNIKDVIETSDDPLGSTTIFPYLKLAEFARKHVSVALAGDGGDEFFCGYIGFRQISQILNMQKKMPSALWNLGAKLGSVLAQHPKVNPGLRILEFNTPAQFVAQFISRMPLHEIAALVSPAPLPTIPPQYVIRNGDYSFPELNHNTASTYLHDTVLKTSDRSTMHVSLEGRLPLTDHRLIELSSRIPFEILLKGGMDKYVLKQILWQYVPRELVDRPKTGFGLPSRDWLFGTWAKLIDIYLVPDHLQMSGALNVEKVCHLISVAKQKRRGFDRIVWNLLTFQMWWEHIVLSRNFPIIKI